MRLRQMICLLLTLMIGVCAGAARAEETEGPTYVMAGLDVAQNRQWKENVFFSRMEEMTGIHFQYQQYTDAAAWTAAKAAMEAGKEMPDVLFKAALSSAESLDMMEKGVLIDLKPYLAECCPHLWAILQQHPDYLSAITLPDGRIAALPYITAQPTQNYLWVNKAWLETLRLDEPRTAEELVDVLTAFQTRDPNRNGRQDEIPLGFLGPFDLKFLGHAFGLIANDYHVFVSDGQVRFMPLEENFRLFITWCRDLYAAGLLDKNGFSTVDAVRQVTDSKATPTYGMIFTPVAASVFMVSWAQDYAILEPLTYDGRQIYRDFVGPVYRGTFAVTSACKDPEAILRWVDAFYTDEGAILATVGKENVDYLVDGDGTWRLSQSAQNDLSAYSADLFTAGNTIDGGGTMPGIFAADFWSRYGENNDLKDTLERQRAVAEAAVRPFPYYWLTAAQLDTITPLQNQIGSYVDLQIARWVLGEEEITDESFAVFKNTLDEMGLADFLAFWQDVLDHL